MTATTAVPICPGRDWCQAEGCGRTIPRPGAWVGDVFICEDCMADVLDTIGYDWSGLIAEDDDDGEEIA